MWDVEQIIVEWNLGMWVDYLLLDQFSSDGGGIEWKLFRRRPLAYPSKKFYGHHKTRGKPAPSPYFV